MNSVLEGRPALKKEVEKIAEVAGYLWQNGWAERNGGNITVNVTDLVDDEIKALPAISEVKQIGTALPALKGCYFFCKGTGKRMRDLARWPMENGSIIRILDDCASYVIIADNPVMPTSELPSHLSVHARLIEKGSNYKATVHTHPIELIAMSHNKKFMGKDVLSNLLFAVQKCDSDTNSQDTTNVDPITQKWWDMMADIMEVNPDNSPVSIPLEELFHMD